MSLIVSTVAGTTTTTGSGSRRLPVKNVSAREAGAGWCWSAACAISRAYLAFVLSLVMVATVPLLLGWQATVVQSGSMMPRIHPGDVVVTMPLPADKPVPLGRVVSFRVPAAANVDGKPSTRLHRIVSVDADGTFVTQGDANRDADSDPLLRSEIIGQARLLVPAVGLPALWFAKGDLLAVSLWMLGSIAAILVVAFDTRASDPPHHHVLASPPQSQEH
jgi:signal peptidase I